MFWSVDAARERCRANAGACLDIGRTDAADVSRTRVRTVNSAVEAVAAYNGVCSRICDWNGKAATSDAALELRAAGAVLTNEGIARATSAVDTNGDVGELQRRV
jgi:hypothetical protein